MYWRSLQRSKNKNKTKSGNDNTPTAGITDSSTKLTPISKCIFCLLSEFFMAVKGKYRTGQNGLTTTIYGSDVILVTRATFQALRRERRSGVIKGSNFISERPRFLVNTWSVSSGYGGVREEEESGVDKVTVMRQAFILKYTRKCVILQSCE